MTVSEKQAVSKLVEHELALKVYISALLEDEAAPLALADEPAPRPAVEAPPQAPELKPPLPTVEVPVEVAEPVSAPPVPSSNAYPDWADQAFEALLFKVGGFLSLATPLATLNTIVTWNDKITPMPGHAEWFLGLLPMRARQVKVIDIAKFVIPENHAARRSLEGERQFKHIIVVGNGEYGLACDDLGDVFSVERDKVRWRTDLSQRPWLAGTLVEQMCALLDVNVFAEMLKDGCPADETSE